MDIIAFFCNNTRTLSHNNLEGCQSGRMSLFAKEVGPNSSRGFESRPFRYTLKNSLSESFLMYI